MPLIALYLCIFIKCLKGSISTIRCVNNLFNRPPEKLGGFLTLKKQ